LPRAAHRRKTCKKPAGQGRYQEAETIYNAVLSKEPGNTAALLGSAYNHSWMGSRGAAEREFNAVLAKELRVHDQR
jgi:hypothetical protein